MYAIVNIKGCQYKITENQKVFIPKLKDNVIYSHIPCMIHECTKNPLSNKYLLYFHGNAEDISADCRLLS